MLENSVKIIGGELLQIQFFCPSMYSMVEGIKLRSADELPTCWKMMNES